MDPNTALKELIDSLRDMDRTGAQTAADALRGWLVKGGFMPTVDEHQMIVLLDAIDGYLARMRW